MDFLVNLAAQKYFTKKLQNIRKWLLFGCIYEGFIT